ncbi:MAG: hypothetical protein IPM69_15435 [Ignavibacteria bacterium]|nr:hypothetical protein [Ignavibacteria bacterium]
MAWVKSTGQNLDHPDKPYAWIGYQPHDTVLRTAPEIGKNYLRSLALGGDFIRPGTDANSIFNHYTPGSYRF